MSYTGPNDGPGGGWRNEGDIRPHAFDPWLNPELFQGVLTKRVFAFLIGTAMFTVVTPAAKVTFELTPEKSTPAVAVPLTVTFSLSPTFREAMSFGDAVRLARATGAHALAPYELSLWLRQRQYAPMKCEGCGLFAECGGGCPLSLPDLAFAPDERAAEG